MAYADRVKETTTTAGTGPFALAGAKSAEFIAFSQGHLVGEKVQYGIRMGAQWQICIGTYTAQNTLTVDVVLSNSARNTTPINFGAGTKDIFGVVAARSLNRMANADAQVITTPAGTDFVPMFQGTDPKLVTLDNFLNATTTSVTELDTTALSDSHIFMFHTTGGDSFQTSIGALRTLLGGTPAPSDTTKPTKPTNLQSLNVTQTSFDISFTAGTDNVGVLRHQWGLDNVSWTNVSGTSGTITFSVTGRDAATQYTVYVRTADINGNYSDPESLQVTTQAASAGDTQDPTWMAGSITTSNITGTGYTKTWPQAQDNVAVARVESSLDGGATWDQLAATATSRVVTGRTKGTTDQLRMRAIDTSNRISNILSATVLNATAPNAPTIGVATPGNGTLSQAFTAPADNGGSAITGFTLRVYRASDNVLVGTFTGATSPINATGLTNGVSVYGKVSCANIVGSSAESAQSTSVTPTAPAQVSDKDRYTNISAFGTFPTSDTRTVNTEYWSEAFDIYIKDANGAFPADNTVKFFWIKSADAGQPSDTLITSVKVSNAWPAAGNNIPYSTNGGVTSGNVPNSVKLAVSTNASSFPGLFKPTNSLFGGGAAGGYYLIIAFADGTYTIFPTRVQVA